VSNHMVDDARPQLGESPSSKRTGLDGKQRPATRRPQIKTPEQEEAFYAKRAKPAPGTRSLDPAPDTCLNDSVLQIATDCNGSPEQAAGGVLTKC